MVVVDLDSSGSDCSDDCGPPVEFDLPARYRLFPFFTEAAQWDEPHFSRVSGAIPFLGCELDGLLYPRLRTDERFFQTLREPSFTQDDESRFENRVFALV